MKKKNKEIRQSEEYRTVLNFLIKQPNVPLNHKQIAAKIESIHKGDIFPILALLVKDGKINEVDRGKFMYVQKRDEIEGVLDFSTHGTAYLVSENLDKDLKLNTGDTLDAFDGDRVKVRVVFSRKSKKAKAFVTEVIERSKTTFVGIIEAGGNGFFVVPDNAKIHTDFYIPKEHVNGAKPGDKVLVEYRDWPAHMKNPFAKVIEDFGKAGTNSSEMHAIVAEFGFRTQFDSDVQNEAEQIPKKPSEAEIKSRRDFRQIPTFTIDPHDAKDFDDALSIRALDDNTIEVGIHIADVAHYVKEGGKIDKEALNRGTSIYLVDRTIPMLPEILSNELCSLRPHEESLCFSVIFKLDKNAKVLSYEFAKTIIYSDQRFAYEEAQELIKGKDHKYKSEIILMNNLAKKLRQKRFDHGAINFETTEFKFELDKNGKPISIEPKMRFDAHKMIEEFMLLANRYVASHLYTKNNKTPIPYRVHEEPSDEKLTEFVSAAANFGYTIDTSNYKNLSKSINEMVEKVQGTLEGDILQPMAIRSMEKAYYTTKKTSHFGLAFDYYTHFTSPIRRYPDMVTHRMLNHYLKHEKYPDQDGIEKICSHCSKQEQKAVSAERASIKYKQTEYLSSFIGDQFEGIISGVTEWGIYVEIIENKCEGMVRIKDISGDNYIFYPDKRKVVGQRTKNTYTMGQKIDIRVKRTNLQRRNIDFEIVN